VTTQVLPAKSVVAVRVTYLWVFSLMLLAGGFVRVLHVLRDDFPLGDGGLFWAVTEGLRSDGYSLPSVVGYNGQDIPFAYPPLGFYLTALTGDAFGLSTLDVMRLLPLSFSLGTLVVFALMARSVFQRNVEVLGAIFAFGMLPLASRYFLMGAGITRSPGLFFALLAIWQAYLYFKDRNSHRLPLVMLAGAATVLSHPNAAWFAAYSILLLLIFYGRDRKAVVAALAIAVGTAVIAAPWWLTVLIDHGLDPFLAAPQASNPGTPAWVLLLKLQLTEEPMFPLLMFSALLGLIALVRDGKWWLPTWLVAACVLDTRYSGTFAMVPVALLAGVGLRVCIDLLLESYESLQRPRRVALLCIPIWLGGLLLLASAFNPGPGLRALPEHHRVAMQWIASNTPATSRFLVVGPAGLSAGSESEWFPVLAERPSVGTYQGTEWQSPEQGLSPWERYNALQGCATASAVCLEDWAESAHSSFTHVYVREENTEALRSSLGHSVAFALVYESDGIWIFEHLVP